MTNIERLEARDKPSLIELAARKLREVEQAGKTPAPASGSAPAPAMPAPAKTASAPSTTPAGLANRLPPPNVIRSGTAAFEIDFKKMEAKGLFTPDGGRNITVDEFRVIKLSVLQDLTRREGALANLVLVTSALPGEGKSFISVNLGMAFSFEQDFRVLLVDADTQRHGLVSLLGIEDKPGLIDVLERESVRINDVLLRTNVPGLTVLPPGPPHERSTELLASDKMAGLLTELSERYKDRVIIIDTPPVLSAAEVAKLAGCVAEVLFVVRAGQTPRRIVREAMEHLEHCPNVRFVLNDVGLAFSGRRQRYDYYKTPS